MFADHNRNQGVEGKREAYERDVIHRRELHAITFLMKRDVLEAELERQKDFMPEAAELEQAWQSGRVHLFQMSLALRHPLYLLGVVNATREADYEVMRPFDQYLDNVREEVFAKMEEFVAGGLPAYCKAAIDTVRPEPQVATLVEAVRSASITKNEAVASLINESMYRHVMGRLSTLSLERWFGAGS